MADFTEFWALARGCRGRLSNGGRRPTEKAWDRAVREGADGREIIAGFLGYESAMNDCDTDFQFRCQASTFVNQWRWEQYLDEGSAKAYLARPELRVVGE